MDNSRLGKGLGAFFGSSTTQPSSTQESTFPESSPPGNTLNVPVDSIDRNPRQPRESFDSASMASLAESIREHGIIQPLIVSLRAGSSDTGPRYVLIAGERRLRAAILAGYRTVPIVIKTATPQQMLEMALIENIQREDLNPIELATAYKMLVEEYNLTQEEVARKVGKDRSSITNQLSLLRMPQELQDQLATGSDVFGMGHAKALSGITDPEAQISLMKQIIAQNLTVRQAEEAARRYKEAALRLVEDRKGTRRDAPDLRALEDEFMRAISLRVTLHRNTRGVGTLTIAFSNEEELNAIYDMLVTRNQQGEEF